MSKFSKCCAALAVVVMLASVSYGQPHEFQYDPATGIVRLSAFNGPLPDEGLRSFLLTAPLGTVADIGNVFSHPGPFGAPADWTDLSYFNNKFQLIYNPPVTNANALPSTNANSIWRGIVQAPADIIQLPTGRNEAYFGGMVGSGFGAANGVEYATAGNYNDDGNRFTPPTVINQPTVRFARIRVIPEPTSLGMLALGLLLFGVSRKRS